MIERLTGRDYYGEATLKGRDYTIREICDGLSQEDLHVVLAAFDRLAYYEDSGLTPEEVEELAIREKTDAARTLRPCVWNGRPARFLRWCDWSEIVAPSAMVGGHNGGELRYTVGIVEFDNGTIMQVLPKEIRFTDGAKMDAKEEKP